MFVDTKENNDFEIDFGLTKVIWFLDTPFIVPDDLTLNERKYLIASQYTLFCGNTSVDNILKNYLAGYEEAFIEKRNKISKLTLKKEDLIKETLKKFKKLYDSVFSNLKMFDFSSGNEASFVCELTFIRLQSSFNACRYLIRYGYYFETYAIQRQILEQLAFVYHVSKKETYKDFNDPTKCIAELKLLYPKAGELYGMLCNRTHIDKSQIKYFLNATEEDRSLIVYNSIDYSLETLYYFLRILDIYCCTFEHCFLKFNKKNPLSFITKKGSLKKNRPTLKLGESYRLKYKDILNAASK